MNESALNAKNLLLYGNVYQPLKLSEVGYSHQG